MLNRVITIGDSKNRFDEVIKQISEITSDYFIQTSLTGVKNIVVPSKKAPKVLLVAHHDIVSGSKGYNDNGSGIAILLECIKYIKKNNIDDVEIVFTDKEEIGGIGMENYIRQYRHRISDAFAINVDVCGLGDTIFYQRYSTDKKIDLPEENEMVVPFSDSYILDEYHIPNVLFITGNNNKQKLIGEIFEHQHNGKLDNKIEELNDAIMLKVRDLIIRTIHEII